MHTFRVIVALDLERDQIGQSKGEYYRKTKLQEVAVVSAGIEAIRADLQLGFFWFFSADSTAFSKFLDHTLAQ